MEEENADANNIVYMSIKIIQIIINAEQKVLGLGENGAVYQWDIQIGRWTLYSRSSRLSKVFLPKSEQLHT